MTMSYQEYFGETHRLVRQTVRKFVEREIIPYVNEWEEQGSSPESCISGLGRPVFWVSATRKRSGVPQAIYF